MAERRSPTRFVGGEYSPAGRGGARCSNRVVHGRNVHPILGVAAPHGPRAVPACSVWKRASRGGNSNPLVPSQALQPGTGRGLLSPQTARRPGVQRVETSRTWWKFQPPRAKPSAATGDRSRPTFPTDRAPSRRAARGNEQAVVEIPTPSCQAKCCDRGPVAAYFHETSKRSLCERSRGSAEAAGCGSWRHLIAKSQRRARCSVNPLARRRRYGDPGHKKRDGLATVPESEWERLIAGH